LDYFAYCRTSGTGVGVGVMATRERMRSLSDVPLPALPRAENTPAPKSDVAPRASYAPSPVQPSLSPDARSPQIDVEEEDAAFGLGDYSPDDAIDDQIADLERWAAASESRDRRDSVRFWILRGVPFLCAALAALAGPLGFDRVIPALAGVAALFIAIDAAWPGSSYRNPNRRAVYELRALQNTIKLRWDKVRLAYPNPTGSKRVANALALLEAIQVKRDNIGKYLGSAEASPGIRHRSD
jgi:hypothetical protein